uniref:Uncharacterized protein n=1 Tax=Salix viminalis TaxID=40686 RepID=A0A6N2LVF4_SALVM
MTSASELFYQRRSRVSRANTDLGLEPSLSDRNLTTAAIAIIITIVMIWTDVILSADTPTCGPHSPGYHLHLWYSSINISCCLFVLYCQERASARLDQGTGQSVPSNNLTTETLSSPSQPRVTGNERLPGAVLLARARLLERLRGVSISGNRQSGLASFGIYNREYTLGDELRVIDAGDWGTDISTGLFAGVSPFNDSTFQAERPHTLQESHKKKPPGLTQDVLHCLQSEVFSYLGKVLKGFSQVLGL